MRFFATSYDGLTGGLSWRDWQLHRVKEMFEEWRKSLGPKELERRVQAFKDSHPFSAGVPKSQYGWKGLPGTTWIGPPKEDRK